MATVFNPDTVLMQACLGGRCFEVSPEDVDIDWMPVGTIWRYIYCHRRYLVEFRKAKHNSEVTKHFKSIDFGMFGIYGIEVLG